MRNILFYDTETSGLKPGVNALLQFGAVEVDPITLEEIATYDFKVKPHKGAIMDQEAAEVNGYKPENWLAAYEPAVAAHRINGIIKGKQLAGHNVKFDNGFLNALFNLCGGPLFFGFNLESVNLDSICTKSIATNKFNINRKESSLWSLALKYGIVSPNDNRGYHDALYDAKLCLQIYRKLKDD